MDEVRCIWMPSFRLWITPKWSAINPPKTDNNNFATIHVFSNIAIFIGWPKKRKGTQTMCHWLPEECPTHVPEPNKLSWFLGFPTSCKTWAFHQKNVESYARQNEQTGQNVAPQKKSRMEKRNKTNWKHQAGIKERIRKRTRTGKHIIKYFNF